MITIGKLGFDLGVNMGGFVQSMASAGQSVSAFAAKNTASFAGARQQFSQLSQVLAQGRTQTLAQQQAIRDLADRHNDLSAKVKLTTAAFDQSAQATQKAIQASLHAQQGLAAYTKEHEAAQAVVKRTEAAFERMAEKVKQTQEQTQKARDYLAFMSTEFTKAKTTSADATASLKRYAQQALDARDDLGKLHTSHAQLLLDIDAEKAKLAQLRADRKAGLASDAEVRAGENTRDRARRKVTASTRGINTADQHVAALDFQAFDQQNVVKQARADLALVRTALRDGKQDLKDAVAAESAAAARQVRTAAQFQTNLARQKAQVGVYEAVIAEVGKLEAAEQQAATEHGQLRAKLADESEALHQVDTALKATREAHADAQDAVAQLNKQVQQAPGRFAQAADSINTFAKQSNAVFTRVSGGVNDFMRGFERITRGVRGATPQITRAYNEVYRLQDRIKSQIGTIAEAQNNVIKQQGLLVARQQAVLTAEKRVLEGVQSIATAEARLGVLQEELRQKSFTGSLAEIEYAKQQVAQQETNIAKRREAAEEDKAQLVVRKNLVKETVIDEEQAKQYVISTTEAYKSLKDQLKLATQRIKEKRQEHKQEAETTKASVKATKEEGFSLDMLIAKLLGFVTWHHKAGDASRVFDTNLRTTQAELGRTKDSMGRLNSFIRDTLVVTIGSTLGNVFGSMINNLRTLGQSGVGQVKSFEQLQFSVNSLLAKQYRTNVDGTISFSQAMVKTRAQTKGFTDDLEKLGIQSTYTSEQETDVFKTLLRAFSSDEAIHITKVMSNFGDVMALSADDLSGLADVFDKMKTSGKVSLQELNEVMKRNVPALEYLGKAYGKTTAEIRGMISSGDILAKDAIPAIVNGIRNDFAGAGEEAQNTLQGLTSSIVDLSQRALRTLFAPMLESVRPLLIEFVGKLSDPVVLEGLAQFGSMLGTRVAGAMRFLTTIVPDVVKWIRHLTDSVADLIGSFSGFADSAYEWGAALLDSFLSGMQSKLSSIGDIIGMISGEFSDWMEPHSPPKMLPNIDKWGTKTADTYYQGMANASAQPAINGLSQRLQGLAGVSIAGPNVNGGVAQFAADSPMAATNTILTYIAQLMEQFVASTGGSSSGTSRASSREKRIAALPENATPAQTAEYYRQLNEERLSGGGGSSRKKKGVDPEKDAKALLDSEIKLATASGDTVKVKELLHEKMQLVEGDAKETLNVQTQLENLSNKAEKAGLAAQKRREAAAKRNGSIAKQDFDAKIKYLVKSGDEAQALALLEKRVKQLRVGSKDYYATMTQIQKLKKGDKSDFGVAFEGLDASKPKPGGDNPAAKLKKLFDEQESNFKLMVARLKSQATAVRTALAPVTQWIHDHQREIGFVLTTIAIRIARAFVVSKVLPLLREFADVLGLVGKAGLKMLTPLNLLKLGINLLVVAWVKDIGGIREIAANLFKDIQPQIRTLLAIFADVLGPGNAGIGAKFTAFQKRLPEIRANLVALFDRIGKAFVDWMGPLSGKMRFQLEAAIVGFGAWMRARGGGMFLDYVKNMFEDVSRWMNGQDPNTFLVGVIAKLVATIASTTQILMVSLVATIGGLIIAYGPQISAFLQKWGDRLTDWIDSNTPTVLTALAHFVGVVGLGILTGALTLATYLAKWTVQLAGWILPGIPRALSVLVDFVAAIGQWFLFIGAPMLVGILGNFVADTLNRLEYTLPAFGLELGRALGRMVTQAFGLAASAIYNIGTWGPQLFDFFVNRLLPAAGHALLGFAKGLIGLVGGVLIGLLDPIMDTIRLGNWVATVLTWVQSFGIDFVNSFIKGLGIEIPGVATYLLGVFDNVVAQFKVFLGIANKTDRVRAITAGFRRDLQQMPAELRPFAAMVNNTTIPAIVGLGGALLAGGAAWGGFIGPGSTIVAPALNKLIGLFGRGGGGARGFVQMIGNAGKAALGFGRTLITQTIPNMVRFAGSLLTSGLAALRQFGAYLATQATIALTRFGVALSNFAVTKLGTLWGGYVVQAIAGIQKFALMIRTQSIPALIDMAKAGLASAIAGMQKFITIIITQGIPGMIAMAKAGIGGIISSLGSMIASLNITRAAVVGFATSALAIAAIGLAIAAVVQKFNEFKATVASASQTMLGQKRWWNESSEAMQRYTDASEEVKLSTLDQAEAVKNLRDEIDSDLQAHIEHQAAYDAVLAKTGIHIQAVEDSLNGEMDALHNKRDHLKLATAELSKAVEEQSRQNAMVRASTTEYTKYHQQLATTTDELARMVDQTKQVTESGTNALAEMVGTTNTYLGDRETAWKTHNETLKGLQSEYSKATTADERLAVAQRITEEQKGFQQSETEAALEYVKQRQEQKRHLGQMLIDYIQAQAAINKYDGDKVAALVDNVAKQYGVQQSVSEKTFLSMRGDIDKFFTSASGNLDGVTKSLEDQSKQLQTNQALVDQLTKQHTMEIVQKFQKQGKYDPAELQAALDKIPAQVDVEIKAKLTDTSGVLSPGSTAAETLHRNARRMGGQISDDIADGMVTGLADRRKAIEKAAADAAEAAAGAAAAKLQIHSPSQVFRRMGHHSMDGLVLGVKDRMRNVMESTATMVGQLGKVRVPSPQLAPAGAGPAGGVIGAEIKQRSGVHISVPITITGNTVRSDDDLHALKQLVMHDVVSAIDTIVLQGLKA